MKKFVFIGFLAALPSLAAEQDLGGAWELKMGDAPAIAAEMPGDNYSALLKASLIPDPFFGTNEWLVQKHVDDTSVFTRRFKLDPAMKDAKNVCLEFESVDDPAEIFLNGERFYANNQFRKWSFDVTGILKDDNVLEVRFPSPLKESLKRKAAAGCSDKISSHGRNTIRFINFLRRTQCQAGWDWGVSVPSSGILGKVRLRSAETAYLDYAWHAQKIENGKGRVTLTAEVSPAACAKAGDEVRVDFEFEGEKKTVKAKVPRSCGPFTIEAPFVVERPRLWWPNGYGEQNLYRYSVSCEGETLKRNLGFRTVEVVREKDNLGGESFFLRVNGVDVFAKGWNWIPTEAFPSRRTAGRAAFQLREAAKTGANMVRVWGGGVYEDDGFYDICDELGLLVWQDMMFACGYYPVDDWKFRDNIRAEVIHQVKRLKSHPSIAIWCGDNESYWCSYVTRSWYALCDRLSTTIAEAVARTDPERFFWPSSPCSGDRRWEENFDYDKGDSHCWGVGGGNRPIEAYLALKVRFMSEYGWRSYPQADYMRRFVSSLDPESPDMMNHVKKEGEERRALAAIKEYFGEPKDEESFMYLTQVLQARLLRKVQNRCHAEMPYCMGVLNWQLNDWWPVYSDSSIDHALNLKAAMYAARRFNKPLVAFLDSKTNSEADSVATVVWDLPRAAKGSLRVTRRRISDGAEVGEKVYPFAFDGAGVKTFGEPENGNTETFLVLSVLAEDASGAVYENEETETVSPLNGTRLSSPRVRVESVKALAGGDIEAVLSAEAPSFATMLYVADDPAGSFDENFVTLLRGRRSFRYTPGAKMTAEEFRSKLTVRNLKDALKEKAGRKTAAKRAASRSRFDTLGAMIDVSRGRVLKIDYLEKRFKRMSEMGYNAVMLYCEDVFRLDGEAKFGYMKGRYTKDDVRKIKALADRYGLEMVPCVETLGHLETVLRWSDYADVKNTGSTLLVGEEKTYALIEKMVAFWADTVGGERIHVGMDEAGGFARARYAAKNGNRDKTEVFAQHLERVNAICAKHGFSRPIIWSDMIYRNSSATHDYYDENAAVDPILAETLPKNVTLCYWDYYHDRQEYFEKMIDSHRKLSENLILAGGIQVWAHFLHDREKTLATSEPFVKAALGKGCREMWFTVWGDDGAASMPDLAEEGLFACAELASGRGAEPNEDNCSRFEAITGLDYRDLAKLGEATRHYADEWPDMILDFSVLYDDPLYCANYRNYLVRKPSETKDRRFYCAKYKTKEWRDDGRAVMAQHRRVLAECENLANVPAAAKALVKVLGAKLDYQAAILEAWNKKDRVALAKIAFEDVPRLAKLMDDFCRKYRHDWYLTSLPFGFERIQKRNAAQYERILEVERRLAAYLSGEASTVEELDEAMDDFGRYSPVFPIGW